MNRNEWVEEIFTAKTKTDTPCEDSPRLQKIQNMSLYDIARYTERNTGETFIPDRDD